MKKLKFFIFNYKFIIINSFIILYFITNFFDGNRGYYSLQEKRSQYNDLTNLEKKLLIINSKLKNENYALSQNIDNEFLDEIYRKNFVLGKKGEKLIILK